MHAIINRNSLIVCITEIIKSRPVLMTRDRTDNGMLQGHGSRLSVRVNYCEKYSVSPNCLAQPDCMDEIVPKVYSWSPAWI